jgi:hypothetical protein
MGRGGWGEDAAELPGAMNGPHPVNRDEGAGNRAQVPHRSARGECDSQQRSHPSRSFDGGRPPAQEPFVTENFVLLDNLGKQG